MERLVGDGMESDGRASVKELGESVRGCGCGGI